MVVGNITHDAVAGSFHCTIAVAIETRKGALEM